MSGKLDDLRKKLGKLFEVDASDTSTGIKISLRNGNGNGNGNANSNGPCLDAYAPDTSRPGSVSVSVSVTGTVPVTAPAAAYGVHIENGRVIREGRHSDSTYNDWVQAVGPALTELEKKPVAT